MPPYDKIIQKLIRVLDLIILIKTAIFRLIKHLLFIIYFISHLFLSIIY